MKQVQRVVTLALALLLIGLPAVTMAQTSSSPAADKGKAADKPATPSASPSTGTSSGTDMKSGTGQASPSAVPLSAADCQNNGWQKFGAKSEAECVAKVKK